MFKQMQLAFCLLLCSTLHSSAYGQIANIVGSVGAINQSMGGAATAMPLDAGGSQYWNPASITDLEETELDIGIVPVFNTTTLGSTLDTNALAPGVPSTTLSGEAENRSKVAILPSMAFVKKIDQSPWRWGVLVTGAGGTAFTFDHRGNNPLTSPPPIGNGDIKITGQFLQIAPTLAYALNKSWSVGIQPNFNVSSLQAEPFALAKPSDADHNGIPTYPKTNTAWAPGLGVQGGVYYHNHNRGLHLGASVKSPQWFLPYHLQATYSKELGQKRSVTTRTDLPMIVSIGLGYSRIPRIKIAVDARYVDFAHTAGFDKVGFTRTGAIRGPGWRSVWVVASGIQYQRTEKFSIRGGYAYNATPIRPIYSVFSAGVPTIVKQTINVGCSYQFNSRFTLATAYEYGLPNSSEGPFRGPSGPIPGSSVKLKSRFSAFLISLIFKY